ncbi:MAG: Gmad2 immunoglobulin-like domain-containing protein [Anaerolineales bacterium]|nr:MAG: Gmad2 immunoglobulin-like domain-containing protein [Anaerolineales bacterium]
MVSRNPLKSVIARNLLATFLLLLFLIGCTPASPTGTSAPSTSAPPPTDAPTPAPDYVAQIRNAQYQLGLPDSPRLVQLVDGKFEETGPTPADITSITVMDHIAHGDLNGDGVDEIAVAVAENYGGTGVFVFIAVYAEVSEQYVFQTSTLVDDRPAINSLSIENGEVALDAITHDSEDPFCCPTLHNARHYRLINNQLQMSDYVTFTPDGKPRTITIESPANGSDAYSSVQVKGSVAISPFENTLAYRIYDVGGVELSAGSLMVTAPDLGAPGTFDETILLGGILSGATIRIEIQDISAKDGSLLAMDSVELVVK